MGSTPATSGKQGPIATTTGSNIPEEVQTLFQKRARINVFVAQFEEELLLLEKLGEACADLATFKERAKHLTLYGPGQPSQVQLKLDLNEWMTAQNNALMKADIIEVYLKEYRRQMASYEADISKRGFVIGKQGALVASAASGSGSAMVRAKEESRSESSSADGSTGSSTL